MLDVKVLVYFCLFQCKIHISTCQNSLKNNFTRDFCCRREICTCKLTLNEKKKDIYFYNRNNGVSCGDSVVRKREESVWLVAAKLAENRGEFTSVHTALATMRNIIKALRDERYWSVNIGKIQMENETIIRTLWRNQCGCVEMRYRQFHDNVLAILLENMCKTV